MTNTYKVHLSDGQKLKHPSHSDLVSNLTIFNEEYDSKRLSDIENFEDNSDYSNYKTLEEVLDNYDPELYDGKSFTVRVKDTLVFSSSDLLGGYDRPEALRFPSNDSRCRENLRKPIGDQEHRGFRDEDCGTLNGFVRVELDNSRLFDDLLHTTKYIFTLVKNMGNHRFWMKKIVSKGKPTEFLMKIKFHPVSTIPNPIDWIKIEADGHASDADARMSQNEGQKFVTALKSEEKSAVECFNFLKDMELEYIPNKLSSGVMTLAGVIPDGKTWIKISSIQGLKDGIGNGLFKEFGETNIRWAIKTLKDVCKITKEDSFSYTALKVIATMYKSFTESHAKPDQKQFGAIFTQKQLDTFFREFYKAAAKSDNIFGNDTEKYGKICNLTQTKDLKDMVYLAADAYWPKIVGYYKQNVSKGDGLYGFSYKHPCVEYFLNQAGKMTYKEVLKIVA